MDAASLATLRAAAQKTGEQPEFNIIHALVVQPDADIDTAVEEIINITIAEVDSEENMHYYYTATSVMDVARRTTPDNHGKICDFLVALKKRQLNHPKTGEPWIINNGVHRVWSDLPCFSWTVVDDLQAISGYSKQTSQQDQRDENLHAFFARLAGYPRDERIDLSCYPQLNINDAFDLETADIPPGRAVPTVRLACWWFIFAASTLWEKVQDPENEDWYLDRWNIYKSGILTTQASMRNFETKELLARALEQMKRAEEGSAP